MLRNARPNGVNKNGPPKHRITSLTYLRLGDDLLKSSNFSLFKVFVRRMHANLDFNPNPENYFKPIVPLKSSKPEFSMEYILEATGPLEPFPFDDETDVPVDGGFAYWIKQVFAKLISLFK